VIVRSVVLALASAFALAGALAAQKPPAAEPPSPRPRFSSARLDHDLPLSADPARAEWRDAPMVKVATDYFGQPLPGPPMIVRSRWTKDHLSFLFECPYDLLNLHPNPNTEAETNQLWNWDVAEVFIGWDFDRIGKYKEFEVSPQGEWVDLDIDRDTPRAAEGARWNSGYTVKSRIDSAAKIWYGEMRIPFAAIDPKPPDAGRQYRLGLYRIAGTETKVHYAWSPTGQTTFHVPAAFGTMTLE
jgi:hypothetical protein